MSSRLEGRWVGRPDTAAAAAKRSEKLKAARNADQPAEDSGEALPKDNAASNLGTTELEQHDVAIMLELAGDKSVHMELGDGTQPLEGVWRIVATLPPDGAEIEISLAAEETDDSEKSVPQFSEKRRFVIDFQQNGQLPGFTLVEKGADPKFGRLYFERQD